MLSKRRKVTMDKEVIEWTHIVRPGSDDCHYRDYLVSGARLLQYVSDCVACLSSVREGTGGVVANFNANFRKEVYAMDELHVTLRLEKVGNTSRHYSFTIVRTIAYSNSGERAAKVLDEPELCADGTVVLVVKPH